MDRLNGAPWMFDTVQLPLLSVPTTLEGQLTVTPEELNVPVHGAEPAEAEGPMFNGMTCPETVWLGALKAVIEVQPLIHTGSPATTFITSNPRLGGPAGQSPPSTEHAPTNVAVFPLPVMVPFQLWDDEPMESPVLLVPVQPTFKWLMLYSRKLLTVHLLLG